MTSFRKILKGLSAGVAVVLLFATLLMSAHHHSSLKNEKENGCSICQISQSNTKSVSSGTSFQPLDLRPSFYLFIPNLSKISSEIVLSSLIRGPPASLPL